MRLDFTGVEGQKAFEPLPAGKYTVEVTDFRESKAGENAKNPGAPIVAWEFTVVGDGDGASSDYEGRKIWDNMAIIPPSENSKGTLWRVKAMLEACGFEVDGEIDFDPEEVLNSTLVIRLAIQKGRKNEETGEEYEPRNTVKAFFPAPEGVTSAP